LDSTTSRWRRRKKKGSTRNHEKKRGGLPSKGKEMMEQKGGKKAFSDRTSGPRKRASSKEKEASVPCKAGRGKKRRTAKTEERKKGKEDMPWLCLNPDLQKKH